MKKPYQLLMVIFIGLQFCTERFADTATFKPERKNQVKPTVGLVATTLRTQFQLDFRVRKYEGFFLAFQRESAYVKRMAYYIKEFNRQVYGRYFLRPLRLPVTVVYFKNSATFRKKTKSNAYGFYLPLENTLYTYEGSGHGTVWHEIMHAYIDQNSKVYLPQWFNEGLAAFYEMAFLRKGKVTEGYTNWRHPSMRRAISRKSISHINKALRQGAFDDGFGYAEARFLFVYLYKHKQLVTFVREYIKLVEAGKPYGPSAIELLIQLRKKKINQINREYLQLAMQLKKNQKVWPK